MLQTLLLLTMLIPLPNFAVGCKRLIILTGTEEKTQSTAKSVLLQALYAKAAPIIVDASVLRDLLLKKTDPVYQEMAKEVRSGLETKKPWPEIYNKLLQSREKEKKAGGTFSGNFRCLPIVFFEVTSQWKIYSLKGGESNLLLLLHSGNLNIADFSMGNLELLKADTDLQLVEHIKTKVLEVKKDELPFDKALPKFLATRTTAKKEEKDEKSQTSDKNSPDDGPWIICWMGHGGSPSRYDSDNGYKRYLATRYNLAEVIPNLEKYLEASSRIAQDVMRATSEQVELEESGATPEQIEKSKENVAVAKKALEEIHRKLNEVDRLYKSEGGSAQVPFVLPGTLRAGVSPLEFARTLAYMSRKLNIKLLYVHTCFSGGVNQAYTRDMLKDVKTPFIFASVGIPEKPVAAFRTKDFSLAMDGKGEISFAPASDFKDFFGLACDYFTAPTTFVEKNKGANPLSVILKPLNYENQPFVFIPHVGTFEAVSLDKKVYVLTNARARAAAWERRPIDLSPYQITLVFPAYIRAPVYFPVRLDHKIISQRLLERSALYGGGFYKGATHLLEELTPKVDHAVVKENFSALCQLITSNPSLYKLFLIRKSGKNPALMEHIIICIRWNKRENGVTKGQVDFWYQDVTDRKSYCSTLQVDDLEKVSADALWKARSEVTPDQLMAFATETIERLARTARLAGKPDKTKEEAALIAEFDAFKNHISLPQVFDALANQLKNSVGNDFYTRN